MDLLLRTAAPCLGSVRWTSERRRGAACPGDAGAQQLLLWPHRRSRDQPSSFCVESSCSPRVCVGLPRVLRFPPTLQRHDIWANWKLKITPHQKGPYHMPIFHQ